jgi:hypothetical protein
MSKVWFGKHYKFSNGQGLRVSELALKVSLCELLNIRVTRNKKKNTSIIIP